MTLRTLAIGSLVANAALAAALAVFHWWPARAPAPRATNPPVAVPADVCEIARGDLDFFIDGLVRGNDPFYTPIVVRTLEQLLVVCLPGQKGEIVTVMARLREHLLFLVAANTSPDQKRVAREDALRVFRDLRARFGSGT